MELPHDIFISYTHADNAPFRGREWVSELTEALEQRLGQLLPRPPRIWRDPKIRGNEDFADKLDDRIHEAAALVSVVSPRYLTSEWCRWELGEFATPEDPARAPKLGVRVGHKSRIFKVVKTFVPREDHPDEVKNVTGYEFFSLDAATQRPSEFVPGGDTESLYWAKLDDLAYDLRDLLLEIWDLPEPTAGPTPRPTPPPAAAGDDPDAKVVFLAVTSPDLTDKRDVVKRELEARDCLVLPQGDLPFLDPRLEDLIRDDLRRAEMSIHLIGTQYNPLTESLVTMQNELAVQRGTEGDFSRLLWLPPRDDGEEADERQTRFIESLTSDERIESGADIFRTPFEDFKDELRKKIEPPPEPVAVAAEIGANGQTLRIYLIFDQRDENEALDVEDYLHEQEFEVVPSLFDGEPELLRSYDKENMTTCDAALIYYGKSNELWVRSKMTELVKSKASRAEDFRAKVIYVAPPENPRKLRFKTHDAEVVQQSGEGFSANSLAPIVSRLK